MLRLAIRFLIVGLCLAALSASAVAEEGRPSIHVQLVLDSSGSMKDNDPKRLSSLAGMIFTDLAGPNDWLGVLSMQKDRFVTEELRKAGEERKDLRDSVRELPFSGSTYCARPLEEAARGLAELRQKEPRARQFVIFFSDGACRGDHEEVRAAAADLANQRVKVFSIGLFGALGQSGVDPTADLRTMAAVTDGEFFQVGKASDLPERFAAILGRIVGSEALPVELRAAQDATAELDGYVYDASFIVTGSGKPVIIDKAAGPEQAPLKLPHRANHASSGEGHYVAAFGTGTGQHYSVLRIDEPAAGAWTFKVDGPQDLKGLLIQNYALDPVVEMAGTRDAYPLGEKAEPVAWLRGKDGKPIDDAKFLEKVVFTAYFTDANGRERELELKPDAGGKFRGSVKLDVPGTWLVRARARMKSGGLDKRTEPSKFEVRATKLGLGAGQKPIDLGTIKAGATSKGYPCDLGGSQLPGPVEVEIRLEGIDDVELEKTSAKLTPDAATFEEAFTVQADHAGGPIHGSLVVEHGGQSVTIEVLGEVLPLTFWERWGRLVIAIGVGLLLLVLFIIILRGFLSPHRFPADARLNWGENMDRLKKNEVVIRELRGSDRGFYRNAKLEIGGPDGFPAGGVRLGELEATGPQQITIRGAEGAVLEKVNKFDESKTSPVEGNQTGIHSGEVYRIGELYLRLR